MSAFGGKADIGWTSRRLSLGRIRGGGKVRPRCVFLLARDQLTKGIDPRAVLVAAIHSKISISMRSYPCGKKPGWADRETIIGEYVTTAAIVDRVGRLLTNFMNIT